MRSRIKLPYIIGTHGLLHGRLVPYSSFVGSAGQTKARAQNSTTRQVEEFNSGVFESIDGNAYPFIYVRLVVQTRIGRKPTSLLTFSLLHSASATRSFCMTSHFVRRKHYCREAGSDKVQTNALKRPASSSSLEYFDSYGGETSNVRCSCLDAVQ